MRRGNQEGFTLIELIVAMAVLLAVAISLVGSSQVAAASARRATLELWAAQLIQEEYERLKDVPYANLANGTAATSNGTSTWTVTDSASFRRVELIVTTRHLAGSAITDTLYLYRVP
jgi:prepilin-type N-terminal cleavage/methylation domain-containing protein